MNSAQIKNIEIHLATKVQENLCNLLEEMGQANIQQMGNILTSETDTSHKNKSAQSETKEGKETELKAPVETHKSVMIHDKSKGASLQELLVDGKKKPEKTEEKKLLSILDEIDQGPSLKPENNIQTLLSRPVPVTNVDFDENMLYEIEDSDTENNHSESFLEDENEDEDEDETEIEQIENSEDSLELKQTDPGYYKSLVLKI